jgi:hypothetical protein
MSKATLFFSLPASRSCGDPHGPRHDMKALAGARDFS